MLNLLRKFGRFTGLNKMIIRLVTSKYEQYFDNALKSQILPSDVVFDVGANIGFYTKAFAILCKKVVAVEPDPSTAEILANNLKGDRHSPNVHIINKALGAENGILKFRSQGAGHVTNAIDATGNLDVEVLTMDNLCSQLGLWPDVIKMDVEGYEYEVLKGSRKALLEARVIGIEVHSAVLEHRGLRRPLKEIQRFLQQAGFKVSIIDPSHLIGVRK